MNLRNSLLLNLDLAEVCLQVLELRQDSLELIFQVKLLLGLLTLVSIVVRDVLIDRALFSHERDLEILLGLGVLLLQFLKLIQGLGFLLKQLAFLKNNHRWRRASKPFRRATSRS